MIKTLLPWSSIHLWLVRKVYSLVTEGLWSIFQMFVYNDWGPVRLGYDDPKRV
jgi:hypothetical protein